MISPTFFTFQMYFIRFLVNAPVLLASMVVRTHITQAGNSRRGVQTPQGIIRVLHQTD
jgi:hypothetical protein